jgi:putative acyl-CoA dehydrogenase
MTPAAKFWVCKRSVEITGEAMEVFGGNGYVQDSIVARLFREAPVNSIWEGSGNVMCLDVLRAMGREPEAARLLLQDLSDMAADQPLLTAMAQSLANACLAPDALEPQPADWCRTCVCWPRPACCTGMRPPPWPMASSTPAWAHRTEPWWSERSTRQGSTLRPY